MPRGAIQYSEKPVKRVYAIPGAQKAMLERLSKITGKNETALVREAISLLLGSYRDVLQRTRD